MPTLFQPETIVEAIALLAHAPVPFDSPTQHRYRTLAHLAPVFEQGRRTPEHVWAVRGDGELLAIAALLHEGPGVLDFVGGPDDAARRAVIAAATAALGREGEAILFTPPGLTPGSAEVAPWTEALAAAGWRPFVDRVHYEFPAQPGLGDDVPLELRLEQLSDPHDPRLLAVQAEILRGTRDAHDAALVAELGLARAARQTLADLFEADPVSCTRLALGADGEPVGHTSWRVVGGRGYALFMGVAQRCRGRGYGRQLLAAQTRGLIAEGAQVLISDADLANHAMIAAFEAVGWPATEARLDFSRSVPD